ncbi:MAG: serine hydrolase domain-containing protein [Pyrinomonadaceae bacterium]
MEKKINRSISLVAVLGFLVATLVSQVPDREKAVAGAERAFEKAAKAVTMPAPGCAVGVSVDGKSVFEKAFGMAEMEHGIPNTAETIFESGSVAKQFTAAALVMLSLEGKLSIDDPVRKYIPELPDYGKPLTIRHILNHTSGLRDWGSVMGVTGVGRGDRVVSQELALDVIFHQKALDFEPGAEYSYSNSGYQLATEIVERVSKQKFPDFVAERIFKPLGMTHSSWRDDYQRLVPGRAQAYSRDGNGPWKLDMPFMNVYGNGGMLTTVGDWLKWNAALDAKTFGEPFVRALETQGILNDGRKINYALGLSVETASDGMKDITHGGSTAGYQTFLARFPDKKLSVAVLCNGTGNNPGGLAYGVFEEIFGPPAEQAKVEPVSVTQDMLKKYVGLWRHEKKHMPLTTVVDKGNLRVAGGGVLRLLRDGLFQLGNGAVRWKFETGAGGKVIAFAANNEGEINRYIAETGWTPTAAVLNSFAGEWYSEEAGATFKFVVDGGKAFFVQRPTTRLPLRPQYKDHFTVEGVGGVMWFERNNSGKITKLHIGASRMRDMPFVRVK